MDRLLSAIGTFPFLIIGSNGQGGGKVHINTARIIEALVIAVVSGAFVSYVTVKEVTARMDERLKALDTRVEKVDTKIERIYGDIYRPAIGKYRSGQ